MSAERWPEARKSVREGIIVWFDYARRWHISSGSDLRGLSAIE